MVGGVWGQTTPHFPLYIVEALLVEAVFARAGGRSPVVNGAIAGVLIGTIGLAAEWAWTHIWMPIPWNSSLLPEAAIAGFIAAVAAGAVGGFIGGSLTGRSGVLMSREDGRRLVTGDRRAALVGGLVLAAVIGWLCRCRTAVRSARRSRCGTSRAASSAPWRPPCGSSRATRSRTPSS